MKRRALRLALAAAVAVAVTAVELFAIAAMNQRGIAAHEDEPRRATRVPIIRPPEPEPPEPSDAPSMSAPRAPAPAAVAEAPAPAPSALPELADLHHGPGIEGVLPGLGHGGGLAGQVSLTEGQPQPGPPDRSAEPVSRPPPRYPLNAARRGLGGVVTVRLRVDASGRVTDVVVVEAEPEGVFEDAAVAAARRYRFRPAREAGEATATTVEQRIVFRPQVK